GWVEGAPPCVEDPLELAAIEVEILRNEAVVGLAGRESDALVGAAQPPVKLSANAVPVLGPGVLATFADLGGVLTPEPSLQEVRTRVLSLVIKFPQSLAPQFVRLRAW